MPRARSLAAFVVTAVLLWPVLWMAATSLRPPIEYVSTSVSLVPGEPTLSHYADLFGQGGLAGKVLNSLYITLGAAIASLALGFPAAYALVRMRLPRRLDSAFLIFVLLVKLAPPLVLAIPLYQVLRSLGLIDTLTGLIFVYQVYTLPFAIWMLLGFVRDVSPSYEEAAIMDGAGLVRRLLTVVLPIMAPGLVATFVLAVIMAWNEFAYAMLYLQTPSKFTLPTFIATMITEDETLWGKLGAVGVVASVPILVLLGLFQKYLVRGLAGGLK